MVKIVVCLKVLSRIGGNVDFSSEIKKAAPNASVVICRDEDDVVSNIQDADVLACFASFFSQKLVKNAKQLRWIHSFAAGIDRFLVPEIVNSEIILTNSSGVHPIPVSEHAFAMILAFERGICSADRNRHASKWDANIDVGEVYGKTICLVGTGRIGAEIARLSKAFGCRVIGVNRSGQKRDSFDKIYKIEKLKEAVKDADYVINILPFTKQTSKLFSGDKFRAMRKNAVYVNVGRGKTTDESALIEALRNKALRAALLDVFENEPLPKNSPLWKMENVIITPHIAGDTPEYLERAKNIFIENLKAFLAKKELPNRVNKKLGY